MVIKLNYLIMSKFYLFLSVVSLVRADDPFTRTPTKVVPENIDLFYNGNETLLELTAGKPFVIDLYKVTNGVAKEKVGQIPIAANATSVRGQQEQVSKTDIRNTLDIKFTSQINGTGADLNSVNLHFYLQINLNTSKWELLNVNIVASGKRTNNCSENCEFDIKNPVIVAEKTGYTSRIADAVCGKGYKTCASMGLCWACDLQTMKPNLKNRNDSIPFALGLTSPGLKLQAFLAGNGTQDRIRFGYSWNCDPLLSIGVWQSLLVSLLLATILFYGIKVNTSTEGNSRFDDPRGKGISVPLTDN